MAAKWSIFDDFSGCMDLKYRRAAILSRPHFCISDTLIHPPNYPEELGATRELGRVHGFSPSASGPLLKAHIWDYFIRLRKMAELTFLASRLLGRTCCTCTKTLSAAKKHRAAAAARVGNAMPRPIALRGAPMTCAGRLPHASTSGALRVGRPATCRTRQTGRATRILSFSEA